MFNLRKRINRKTYWLALLILYSGLFLFAVVVSILPLSGSGKFEPQFDIPLSIVLLGLAWYLICITRQRANDISGNHPLAWLFFSVFLIGPIIGIIPGEKTTNKFGPVPADFNLLEQ